MQTEALIAYLDDYLCVRDIPDYRDAFNGLQVQGRSETHRIAVAVDACLATIEQAVAAQADLMIVHHGLFWGPRAPLTGAYYRRVATLIRNEIGLYSCHLPLDTHPEVGNNHVLARLLGLTVCGTFYRFESVDIGVRAETELFRPALVDRVRAVLQVEPKVIPTGPEVVRRVGIVTGGGGSGIAQADAAGLDTLITGEGTHHTFFEAEERGLNVLYAGHYATETVGVRALGEHLKQHFGLEYVFLDHPTGL